MASKVLPPAPRRKRESVTHYGETLVLCGDSLRGWYGDTITENLDTVDCADCIDLLCKEI